jgi:DNA-directed RNA polymerase subunit RPC12/RpoP
MCFGDERDAKYICTNCRIEYSKDITPLEYISCPLEASNTIIKGDCINGELRTKRPYYSFLKNKEVICKMICPHMGTEVEIKTRRNICDVLLLTFIAAKGMI